MLDLGFSVIQHGDSCGYSTTQTFYSTWVQLQVCLDLIWYRSWWKCDKCLCWCSTYYCHCVADVKSWLWFALFIKTWPNLSVHPFTCEHWQVIQNFEFPKNSIWFLYFVKSVNFVLCTLNGVCVYVSVLLSQERDCCTYRNHVLNTAYEFCCSCPSGNYNYRFVCTAASV